jgi:hypothetical protein
MDEIAVPRLHQWLSGCRTLMHAFPQLGIDLIDLGTVVSRIDHKLRTEPEPGRASRAINEAMSRRAPQFPPMPMVFGSGRNRVHQIELGPVIHTMPGVVTGLALIPDLFADRHADTSLVPAASARDPRPRMDVGELVWVEGRWTLRANLLDEIFEPHTPTRKYVDPFGRTRLASVA